MKCKVGVFALVISSSSGANIGKVVKVVMPAFEGRITLPTGRVIVSRGGRDWVVVSTSDDFYVAGGRSDHGCCYDSDLMPIGPDSKDVKETEKEMVG
ncbi:MAG: hypothetical protein ACI9JM_002913 [Halioglobus sp.]|jgi:hypothetical protein